MSKLFEIEYEFNRDIIIRDCSEVTLAFNPENSDVYEFNTTGAFVLQKLREEITFEELYALICEEYNTSEEDIDDEIIEIVERLIDVNVINIK